MECKVFGKLNNVITLHDFSKEQAHKGLDGQCHLLWQWSLLPHQNSNSLNNNITMCTCRINTTRLLDKTVK